MRKPKNYNLRIFELDKKNISFRDIIKTIYKEYSIVLTQETLQKKLSPVEKESIKSYINKSESKNKELILSLLNNYSQGLTSKEISDILRKEHNIFLNKREINKFIFGKLLSDINYCKNTFKYSLKSFTSIADSKTENEFDKLIKDYSSEIVLQTVSDFFKQKLITGSTGNDKIDYLIKLVVKDNIITEAEELFLKNKAKEFGFKDNVIDQAKKLLEQNNPYLDNIIHFIFDDGIISNDELLFLKEKTTQPIVKN